MQTIQLNFQHDSSHGYCKATDDILKLAGLDSTSFSDSSFRNDKTGVYALEEDCDMTILLAGLLRLGHTIKFKETHFDGDSIVRQWPRLPDTKETAKKYLARVEKCGKVVKENHARLIVESN